jgi:hypothetical protein
MVDRRAALQALLLVLIAIALASAFAGWTWDSMI